MPIYAKDLKVARQLLSSGGTVCLVGGCKTTLMYALTQHLEEMVERDIIMTAFDETERAAWSRN